jgi:hypothetical protein
MKRIILEVRREFEERRSIVVAPGPELRVGRAKPSEVVLLGDPTMSRSHFALACDARGCTIRDLDSTAGTLVNGAPIFRATLRDGDVIEAGQTTFVVRIEPEVPAPRVEHRPMPRGRPNVPTEELPRPTLPPPEASLHDLVLDHLRAQPDPLFAILDAARDQMVLALYEGIEGQKLSAFAPYLVALPPRSPMLETLVREGWGKSWGIYLTCGRPFVEVRKHLRHFLMVKTEAGQELYFRFYDPRVLRPFLPTCTPDELAKFFGPIRGFLAESPEADSLLRIEFDGQRLRQRPAVTSNDPGAARAAATHRA